MAESSHGFRLSLQEWVSKIFRTGLAQPALGRFPARKREMMTGDAKFALGF